MITLHLPLSAWQMRGREKEASPLLGLGDLLSFKSLWEEEESPAEEPEDTSATFHLPGLLPESDEPWDLYLSQAIPYGYTKVLLFVPPLLGMGTLSADQTECLRFCSLPGGRPEEYIPDGRELDVSEYVRSGMLNLHLHFEQLASSGISDIFTLCLVGDARLVLSGASRSFRSANLTFSAETAKNTALMLKVSALSDPVLFETILQIPADGEHSVSVSLPLSGNMFYRAVLMDASSAVLDECICPVGRQPGIVPMLPLPNEEIFLPEQLASFLKSQNLTSVFLSHTVSLSVLNTLWKNGIRVCFSNEISHLPAYAYVHPAVSFLGPPPPIHSGIASAWQLTGLISQPRVLPRDSTFDVLFEDLFHTSPGLPGLPPLLANLHLLYLRHHAESARQGIGTLLLCAPQEWEDPEVTRILTSAFSFPHLSLFPVRGAFYGGSTLLLHAALFVPESEGWHAEIDLLGSDERILSQWTLTENDTCRCILPETPECLEVQARLYREETVIEQFDFPVYVGSLALLEALVPQLLPGAKAGSEE